MRHLIFLALFVLAGCDKKEAKQFHAQSNEFVEGVIDVALQYKNDQRIDLPDLYDSLATVMPADSVEKMVLAEHLKHRGFEVVNWGRGNFPPNGVRIVQMTLQHQHTVCEISKMYYVTLQEDHYAIVESIACHDE